MNKILSIFIDESGDFGKFNTISPYYLVTMLFHDQSCNISKAIVDLDADSDPDSDPDPDSADIIEDK